MKRSGLLKAISILLTVTCVVSSVPVNVVYAATSEDIAATNGNYAGDILIVEDEDSNEEASDAEDTEQNEVDVEISIEDESDESEEASSANSDEVEEVDPVLATEGDFEYTTYEESGKTYATITKYTGTAAKVVIPETITDNKYPVKKLGDRSFQKCVLLEEVSIPESVISIGRYAFEFDSKLKKVNLPLGLKYLGCRAFRDCSSLEEINVPKSLDDVDHWADGMFANTALAKVTFDEETTKIPNYFFEDCDSLTTIVIPDTVKSIGEYAFQGADNLKQVTLSKKLESIGRRSFQNCKSLEEITIPETVTTIDRWAFEFDSKLKKVNLPHGLTYLGCRAFRDCSSLEEINVPKSLESVDHYDDGLFANTALKKVTFDEGATKVPDYFFQDCDSLTGIVIPNTVTEIGDYAFANADNLKWVTLNDGLKSIGIRSFQNCISLEEIKIPDTVTYIARWAFEFDNKLKKVKLPSGLTYLGCRTFRDCSSLEEINVPKSLIAVDHYDDGLLANTALTKVTFDEGTTRIPDYFFEDCDSLTSLVIPDTITEIGKGAFKDADNVSICCSNRSAAAIYAIENDIPFVVYGDKELTRRVFTTNNTYYYLKTEDVIKATVAYEIAEGYESISDRKLKVRIPSNCEITESSIMLNGTLCQNYTFENKMLVIPVTYNKVVLTFDLIRKDAEKLYTYSLLTFSENGTNNFEIIDMLGDEYVGVSINADQIVTNKTFTISGVAPKSATVSVFVDGEKVGTTTASKAGHYSYEVTLSSPLDEFDYDITVKSSAEGKDYSASTYVTYATASPEITDFKLFYNNRSTGVDLLNENKNYIVSFAPGVPFTFTIDLTNQEQLEHVYVTSTRNNIKRSLEAFYDEDSGHYIATGYFDESDHRYVPGALHVEYQLKHEQPLVQDTIPTDMQVKLDKLSQAYSKTTVTTIKKDDKTEEYSFDIGKTLEDVNEDLSDVVLDYNVSLYDEASGQSVSDFIGMTEDAFELMKYVIPGVDGEKYYAALDYTDPSTYTMIVKDTTSAANSYIKVVVALQGEGEWTWANGIADNLGLIAKGAGLVNDVIKNEKDYDKRRSAILQSSSIEDKEEALRKNEQLRDDQNAFAIMMCAYALLPAAIGLTGPVAIGFSALLGIIGMSKTFFWNARIADMMGKDVSLRWAIDPSGYVYSQVLDNRLENVKVTALYKKNLTDAKAIVWDAGEFDQINPLYTDADGKYAWDVPEGFWAVQAEMAGYKTTTTDWMEVPPPRTDVAIRLVPSEKPKYLGAKVFESYTSVYFDQYMDPDTITGIKLADSKGNNVAYTVSFDGSEDENNKLFASEFILSYENFVKAPGERLSIEVPETVKSADGVAIQKAKDSGDDSSEVTFEKNVAVKVGKMVKAKFTVTNYAAQTYSAQSNATTVATVEKVEIGKDGKGTVLIKGYLPGKTTVDLIDNKRIVCASVNVQVVKSEDDVEPEEIIYVNSISLSPETLELKKGEEKTVKARVLPANATDKTLSWSCSNEKVATVSNDGKITAISAGEATITAKANDGSGKFGTCKVTVKKESEIPEKGIYIAFEGNVDKFTYTGKAIKPGILVYYNGKLLKESADYAVTYNNNINVGKATAVIKAKGDYKGNVTRSFTIEKADISNAGVIVKAVNETGKEKQGKYPKISATVSYMGKALSASKDYTLAVDWKANPEIKKEITKVKGKDTEVVVKFYPVSIKAVTTSTKKGKPVNFFGENTSAKIKVYPKGAKAVTESKYVDLKKGSIEFAKGTSYNYSGFALKPEVKVYAGKGSNKGEPIGDKNYEVSYTSNINKGTATVTVTGIESMGYMGTLTRKFTIKPLDMAKASSQKLVVEMSDTVEYSKGGVKPVPVIKFLPEGSNPIILRENVDYKLSYSGNNKVGITGKGAPKVTIKGLGNFTGSRIRSFKITQKDISKTTVVVTDKAAKKGAKGSYFISKPMVYDEDGKKLAEKTDYYAKYYYKDVEIGKATTISEAEATIKVVISGTKAYTGTASVYYKVRTIKNLASVKTEKIKDKEYTGKAIRPDSEIKLYTTTGKGKNQAKRYLTYGKDFEIALCYNNVKKGTATYLLRGIGEYSGYKTLTFKIVQAKVQK